MFLSEIDKAKQEGRHEDVDNLNKNFKMAMERYN